MFSHSPSSTMKNTSILKDRSSLFFFLFAISALFTSLSKADILWTGAASDNQFWTVGNWDFSNASGLINAGTFAPGIIFDDNVVMTNAGSFSSLITVSSSSGIRIGNGFTLNLNNSFVTIAGVALTNGLRGVDDNASINGTPSLVSLINGSFISSQFATEGLDISVDSTSHLELRGAGDPLNSQVEITRLFMTTGSRWTLPTIDEFYEQAFANNGANTIFVNGIAVFSSGATSAANSNWLNLAVFSQAVAPALTSSQTATAIPEPGTLSLLAWGMIFFSLRRKQ
jgi:hypothetical protein